MGSKLCLKWSMIQGMALVSLNHIVLVKTIAYHPYRYKYLQDPKIAKKNTRIFAPLKNEFVGAGMKPPGGQLKATKLQSVSL